MIQENGITCKLQGIFPALSASRCGYIMTNRSEGRSRGVFASNNMSLNVGDDYETVMENRLKIKERLSLPSLLSAGQVHGTEVFCLTEQPLEDMEVQGFDALVTDLTGVGLMIQQADCQAVLLFDPGTQAIAAIHCGWRGSVQNIVAKTVAVMIDRYGTNPSELYGKISPSLGPCCAEFVNFREEFPDHFTPYMTEKNYFDFWRISQDQMCSSGMQLENIEVAGICTHCTKDYFSYRAARLESAGVTGRNCSLIFLQN